MISVRPRNGLGALIRHPSTRPYPPYLKPIMNVLVVESPGKVKSINKYLGSGYRVLASFGHIRDLPAKDGSVRPDEDFSMSWEVDPKAQKRIKDIADALKGADKLILATDPDREGEAISWHVLEVLRQKKALGKVQVERVVFNAITKNAVLEAIRNPRGINEELVDAYLARRALDYLVGFTLSPVLWRKLPGARSAGRVQSVALRLVVEREAEIEAFRAQEYWTVDADVRTEAGGFGARLTQIDGKKLDKLALGNEAEAKRAVDAIRAQAFRIGSVESKPVKRHPSPPFITSTLQMEASRKLGFNAKHTMRVAQQLYEGVDIGGDTVGLITYMRTDGLDVAPEAITEARHLIGEQYGKRYVPGAPRKYVSKQKNAQEAHEAIRPTSFARRPEGIARRLDSDQARLYELIWKRALASQMESAELERTTVDVVSADSRITLRATGSVTLFDGFLTLYQEGRDEPDSDESGARLPRVKEGEAAAIEQVKPEQHFTEPPPRYSEATLVRKLEELGIGRPSTYASILSTLRDRAYVRMERNRFVPDDKGRIVTTFLTNFFRRYVEYGFTADLEEKLDEVSAGTLDWKQLLRDFWRDFSAAIGETKNLKVSDVISALDEVLGPHLFVPVDGEDPRVCPTCGNGRLSLKLGRFGAFVGCSNYPECRYTRKLGQSAEQASSEQPRELGHDPETGEPITLRTGRFGPYAQRGEGDKPARASIPKGTDASAVDLEHALMLLSLPREIGKHPETGEPIVANFGRYGPYVQHQKTYASLESPEDVFTVGINRAVTLLAEKKANPRGRRGPEPLKELGTNQLTGAAIKLMRGRYGPYVTDGTTNATIPNGTDPLSVSLDQALTLIAEREAKGGGKKKKNARPATAKKTNGNAKTKSAATKAKKSRAPVPAE